MAFVSVLSGLAQAQADGTISPIPQPGVIQISAGGEHTCALLNDGGVKCWGRNHTGQLGDGSTQDSPVPVQVKGLTSGVIAITSGSSHSCALTSNGGVKCWGLNNAGQLGGGTLKDGLNLTPVTVKSLSGQVKAITAGGTHTCALTRHGQVNCWGGNYYGQLGNGTTQDSPIPVTVQGLSDEVTAIAAGSSFTCALTRQREVKCWGDNSQGQLGNGTAEYSSTVNSCQWVNGVLNCEFDGPPTYQNSLTPVQVNGLTDGVTSIATSSGHACAIIGGRVNCWGGNNGGQLGDTTSNNRAAPIEVKGLNSWAVALATGDKHTCALTGGGGVKCWGNNYDGQLGDGTTMKRLTPVTVHGLTYGVTAITAGSRHTCALTEQGQVRCWGKNEFGQLGNGAKDYLPRPVAVNNLSEGVTAIAAAGSHACAVTGRKGVECWGSNQSGQLGDSTTNSRATPVRVNGLTGDVVAVAAGGGGDLGYPEQSAYTCVLTGQGKVICWGDESVNIEYGRSETTDNQLDPVEVTGLTGQVTAIAAGRQTCAVTGGGGIQCYNFKPVIQIGEGIVNYNPPPEKVNGLAEVTALAIGNTHTCALTQSGGAKCWGDNSQGQLGNGTTNKSETPVNVSSLTQGVTAITVGSRHTCALTGNGKVKCWGNNFSCQLGNCGAGNYSSQYPTPVEVRGLTGNVTAIAAGSDHTCAVVDGGVKCWGNNEKGQLGDGTTESRETPVNVIGLNEKVIALAAGYRYTCALTVRGGVNCWGLNSYGQLGHGQTGYQAIPIPVKIGVGDEPVSAHRSADAGLTLLQTGTAYADQKRYPEAIEAYRQALETYQTLGSQEAVGAILFNLGEIYRRQERETEALTVYRQAVDTLEATGVTIGHDRDWAGFTTGYRRLYEGTTELLHRQGQDEEAFLIGERGRAWAFLTSPPANQVPFNDAPNLDLLLSEQSAYVRREQAQTDWAAVDAAGLSNPVGVTKLATQLTAAEGAYRQSMRAITTRVRQLSGLLPGHRLTDLLTIERVQHYLDEHSLVISYYPLEQGYLVFLIKQNNFQTVELALSDQVLTEQVNLFRQELEAQRKEGQTAPTTAQQTLYQLLITPLSPALTAVEPKPGGKTARLLIIPPNGLEELPVTRLVNPATGLSLEQEYRAIILPSARVMPFLTANQEMIAAQGDAPAKLCELGNQLSYSGHKAEGHAMLEVGFTGRARGSFAKPADVGVCALRLAKLRSDAGDLNGAVEAYRVAWQINQEINFHFLDSTILQEIGWIYRRQGLSDEALNYFQQALNTYRSAGSRQGEGLVLPAIGLIYSDQGRYAEALTLYEQALALNRQNRLEEEPKSNNIPSMFRQEEGIILNNIGLVYEKQQHYESAIDYYHQALIIHRETNNQKEEATTLGNLGRVYTAQAQYAEALESYRQTLALYREAGNREQEGNMLYRVGRVYEAQEQYAEAQDYYRQALAIHQEVGNQEQEGVTLNHIGLVYSQEGEYSEALANLQTALAIYREVGQRSWEALALNHIGQIRQAQGRYGEALDFYLQAVTIDRIMGNREQEGMALNHIGQVYQAQGRFAEALVYFRQALAGQREETTPDLKGLTFNNLGLAYHQQRRYAEALDYYQQALALYQQPGDYREKATTLHNLGRLAQDQAYYPEALNHYRQALVLYQERPDPLQKAAVLNHIGQVYQAQGHPAEALANLHQALTIYQTVDNRAQQGDILATIGSIYTDQGRPREALESYQQALEALETVRASAGSETGRMSFIGQYAALYDHLVALLHRQGQDERAFFTAERGRARAFLDGLATGHVQLGDQSAADLLTQEQEAFAKQQVLQTNLAQARAQYPTGSEQVVTLEAQLAEAEQAYAGIQANIEARGEQLRALVPGYNNDRVLTAAKTQALLDDQTTLLAYYLLDEQTLAFILTRDNFQVVDLSISKKELGTKVNAFRKFIDVKRNDTTRWQTQELYRLLITPLAGALQTPRLIIIPHGVLHYLPFAALLNPETNRYLLEDYTLTTLPSASALPFVTAQATTEIKPAPLLASSPLPLIVGNPTTSDFDPTASLAAERNQLSRLPFAGREAEKIAALYGVEPLLGDAATEEALRTRAAGASLIHLAAHGYYNSTAPLSSFIALASSIKSAGRRPLGPNTQSNNLSRLNSTSTDGWLTVAEVYSLDLRQTDLVVLSACQTQLGELSAGDDVVGLTRAFIFAGTPTVIASLWNVNDKTTGFLMERFYLHLKNGLSKAGALRQAQLETLAKYPEPYYWAAFVLSGDGEGERQGDDEVRSGVELWLPWLVGGLLLAGLIAGGMWWRRRVERDVQAGSSQP